MKIFKNFFKVMAIVAVTFFATSCNNDDSGVVEKFPTVAEILKADPANFSLLEKALLKTDLLNTFRNPGSYTVFAPTNAAFATISVNDAFIDALVPNTAAFNDFKKRLQYHVLALNLNGIYTTELPTKGYMNTFAGLGTTTTPLSIFINQSNGIVINGGTANGGATVSTANVQASNGVVHVVNAVLALPTVVSVVVANPDLSVLKAAVTSSAQSSVYNDLVAATGASTALSRTVYAPSNDAFTAATFLPGQSDANVTKVLNYHIENNNRRSATSTATPYLPTFLASATVATTITTRLSGQTISNPLNSARLVDTTAANGTLITVNIQATNGVVHILNKVLVPTL